MSDGRVVSLQRKREHWSPLEATEEVVATALGLEGDRHAGRDGAKRQVLLVDAGDLRDLGLRPGDLREQITVDLPGLMSTPPGSRLRIGEAVLELTGVCEPCTHIGGHLGVEDVEAFQRSLRGRRGMLARVVTVGIIRVGDPVEVLGDAERLTGWPASQ